ncbi:hypothetical protein PN498_02015 [Oscillatoria sp. CS-180]|uniref:hypothetical protein n=1 Tax=Oscillatoria sp. CS-180 TaxID=3021720 RepID=UPI00232F44DD|nr:hypothetical protein [Oscillatoria sp. CS-180]MDB9524749.1 hypothetical protein [Oscillatoria sp. CS-180]
MKTLLSKHFSSGDVYYSVGNLRACFELLDVQKALGVDGVTKAAYGANLEFNLQDLHRRLYQNERIRVSGSERVLETRVSENTS